MRKIVWVVIGLLGSVCLAEITPEVRAVAEYQKKNKAAVIKAVQQEGMRLKKAGDSEQAKALKALEKDIRAGNALWRPRFDGTTNMAGTIKVEKILDKTDEGCWIQTSLPVLEPNGPTFQYVNYPKKVFVQTDRALRVGESIFIRPANNGYAEVSEEEVAEATKLLK